MWYSLIYIAIEIIRKALRHPLVDPGRHDSEAGKIRKRHLYMWVVSRWVFTFAMIFQDGTPPSLSTSMQKLHDYLDYQAAEISLPMEAVIPSAAEQLFKEELVKATDVTIPPVDTFEMQHYFDPQFVATNASEVAIAE